MVDINIMARKYLKYDSKCKFAPEQIIEKLDQYMKKLIAERKSFDYNSRKSMAF